MENRAAVHFRFWCVHRCGALILSALSALFVGTIALAKDRQWTSSVGTQIEATCIAKVGNEHWLLARSGRIIKLTPEKLSPLDATFLESIPVTPDAWINSGSVVALATKDAGVEETLVVLATTKIPVFSVSNLRLEDAFRVLSDAIQKNDPKQRRIEFHVDPALAERTASVETRGMTGLRLIGFIFSGDSGVYGTIGAGRVDFTVHQRPPATGATRP